jgi:hypothetical protein
MASDSQIEAAARAIRKVVADRIWSQTDMTPTAWDDLKPFQRDAYRAEAKAAIEAAADEGDTATEPRRHRTR